MVETGVVLCPASATGPALVSARAGFFMERDVPIMGPMSEIAEVIAIGDELTTGQRVDTNTAWISERLGELGLKVIYHSTVSDDLAAGREVFRRAIERADLVVASGGLGPTADDLTREMLAEAASVGLVHDEQVWQHIQSLFRSRGRQVPERNICQASFPTGARPIPNPQGTAPGSVRCMRCLACQRNCLKCGRRRWPMLWPNSFRAVTESYIVG